MVDMIDYIEETQKMQERIWELEAAIEYLAESGAYLRRDWHGTMCLQWWLENPHGLVQQDTHDTPMQAIKAGMQAAKGVGK
jgi:hypothetical protein